MKKTVLLFFAAALLHLQAEPCNTYSPRVDFLYWQADQDGLEYGTKMVASSSVDVFSTTNTHLLDLNFEWDPGFRIGFGALFPRFDTWGIDANWTHIHNHAHAHSSAAGIEDQINATDTIIPLWLNLLNELRWGAASASAHWDLEYNTADLVLAKDLWLTNTFFLRPYFGFRGAWIDQDYKVNYNTVFILEEDTPTFTRIVNLKAENDFIGFGLRTGAEMNYHFTPRWYFYSQFSAHLLYGQFQVKLKNLHDQGLGDADFDATPLPTDFYTSEEFWRVRLNFEETLGLGWQRYSQCEKFRLRLLAAVEMSQYLGQNQLYSTFYFRAIDAINLLPVRNPQGNLSFFGLRLTAQFDY